MTEINIIGLTEDIRLPARWPWKGAVTHVPFFGTSNLLLHGAARHLEIYRGQFAKF